MKIKLATVLLIITITATASQWLGQSAPSFDLADQNGEFHKLEDYEGQWLVLYFYPADDTPGCTTEAKNFTEDYEVFKKLGAEIIGVSVDDIKSHKEFADKYNIPFTLLADKDEVMSEDYDVIRKVPLFHHAKRQTFIISPKGIIRKHYEEVTPSTHSKEVIKDLKSLIQEP